MTSVGRASAFLIPVTKATKIKKSFVLEIKHLQLITEYILKQLRFLITFKMRKSFELAHKKKPFGNLPKDFFYYLTYAEKEISLALNYLQTS